MFNFYVSVNTSDAQLGALPIFQNLAKLQETKIKSKSFASYKECTDTAQLFVTDILNGLNVNGGKFFAQTAFNPALEDENKSHPGVGQLANWPKNEIFRFYVVSEDVKDEHGIKLTKLVVSILSHKHNQKDS